MKRKIEIEKKAFEAAMQHGFNAPSYEAGAAWADKTMIDKACEWLSEHFYDEEYQFRDDDGTWIDADLMITDFRKAMED